MTPSWWPVALPGLISDCHSLFHWNQGLTLNIGPIWKGPHKRIVILPVQGCTSFVVSCKCLTILHASAFWTPAVPGPQWPLRQRLTLALWSWNPPFSGFAIESWEPHVVIPFSCYICNSLGRADGSLRCRKKNGTEPDTQEFRAELGLGLCPPCYAMCPPHSYWGLFSSISKYLSTAFMCKLLCSSIVEGEWNICECT